MLRIRDTPIFSPKGEGMTDQTQSEQQPIGAYFGSPLLAARAQRLLSEPKPLLRSSWSPLRLIVTWSRA